MTTTLTEAEHLTSEANLLRLDGMPADRLCSLLHRTRFFAQQPPLSRLDTLAGHFVANLFFEDSTRTRLSFAIAARRLGADVINLTGDISSVKKGETLEDTGRVVESQGASALVVRSKEIGGGEMIAKAVSIPVLNAGDGSHEHPTQGLLDVYTIAEAHNRQETFDLSGLTVLIVGDIANSRVARSDTFALTTLGARVVCVGPPELVPDEIQHLGCEVTHDLDAALIEADAVQMLRMQFERGTEVGSLEEYCAKYQLNVAREATLKPDAIVMHPGPMNRGVEIESAVADGARSRILRQDSIGVFVRMAALEQCIRAAEAGHS